MIRYGNTDVDQDVSRIGFQDLIKNEKSNDNFERFESNISVHKKEDFDETNKTINSLNEELVQLKRKMKFVYEKDTEIQKLKSEKILLEKELGETNKRLNSIHELQKEIETYKNKNDELQKELLTPNKELLKENSLLKRELHQLKNKDEEDGETIDFDVEVKIKEKMKVDIDKLKNILNRKLENKRDERVDELLSKYKIRNNSQVDKDLISDMIKEIIS